MSSTDVVAWLGVLLGGLGLARDFWRHRDRIGLAVIQGSRNFQEGPGIFIRVKNYSLRPVCIEEIGLAWPWPGSNVPMNLRGLFRRWQTQFVHRQLRESSPIDLPNTLEPGHAYEFWVPLDAIDDKLDEHRDRLTAYVRDALDRTYYSGRITLPRRDWRERLRTTQ